DEVGDSVLMHVGDSVLMHVGDSVLMHVGDSVLAAGRTRLPENASRNIAFNEVNGSLLITSHD
ncbi:MAG: hypothetical protein L7W43_18375, partial [Rubripirellula sp.]|nr:hypothetical protein [Rubripirellula sp.]